MASIAGSATSSSYEPYARGMPAVRAASVDRPRLREAIATTSTPRAAFMAGIIFLSAKRETPSTPNRNMGEPSDHAAVADDAVLGDDHDALADEVAVPVVLLDSGFVDDADVAADARVLVDDRVLDHGAGADADRGNAARLGLAHLIERLVDIGADE